MRVGVTALACLLGACGIGLSGLGVAPEGDAGAADGAVPVPVATDGAVDGGGLADAVVEAAAPPDPSKVTVSYALGNNKIAYKFDAVTATFTPLPSAGCPAGEETAVLTDGTVYVTSSDSHAFYKLSATGCQAIKTNSSFPFALGTAPVGTVSATEETLVGYVGGDYVKVDPTNGDVTVIKSGALGFLRPSGDVTAIGTRGFLAAQTNTGSGAFDCPNGGDCIVEVNVTTGEPVAFVQQLVGFGIYGIAHSKGQLLLYANGQVFPYDVGTKTLGAALAVWPGGTNFSGAGAAPYPGP